MLQNFTEKMEIINIIKKDKLKKEAKDNLGFLQMNNKGDYLWLTEKNDSRYEGLFFYHKEEMFKIIDSIKIKGKIKRLENHGYFSKRRYAKNSESFFITEKNCMIYMLDKKDIIDISLDVRRSYENPELNRLYDIDILEDKAVIRYYDNNTDLFICIKADSKKFSEIRKWENKFNEADKKRNSFPYEKYVFKALKIDASRLAVAYADTKEESIRIAEDVFDNPEDHISERKKEFERISSKFNIKDKKINMAAVNAANSLRSLETKKGLFAGLPWFFQVWARDEAISLKALSDIEGKLHIRNMLFDLLENIKEDGNIETKKGFGLRSADAAGWTFFRCKELLKAHDNLKEMKKKLDKVKRSNDDKVVEKIIKLEKKHLSLIKKHEEDIGSIKIYLKKTIDGLLAYHTKYAFAINENKETWIDSSYESDIRAGARIEIQALRLFMYRFMYELSSNNLYKKLEEELKEKVRKHFFDGNYLYDGLDDKTIRPNIFIAAYIYPELLSKEEWSTCFSSVIDNLWLSWGGLSSIDKEDGLFCERHTGEDHISYHRGDSWFWINNLAALVMHRTDDKKFKKYIDKILEASTHEILFSGAIGHAAEVSSANSLKSEGCVCQAWSNAMYIELVKELF